MHPEPKPPILGVQQGRRAAGTARKDEGAVLIDEKLKAAIERALADGCRVQLKRMKDGTIKAQIVKMEEIKK